MHKMLISGLLALLLITGCSSKEVPTIGVNALAADPTAFKGEIAVKAVVQKVEQDKSTITIIDEQEYKTCGLNPCGGAGIIPLYLPDSSKPLPSGDYYSGELPEIESQITVIGQIISGQQGFFFEVDKILEGSEVVLSKGSE